MSKPAFLKVLIADPVSPRTVEELTRGGGIEAVVQTGLKEDALIATVPTYSAIVVRSQTKITAKVLEAATKLRAVGRAGVGVDNVDVEAATRRGVIVMNTPDGNTISTAEHAFSLLVATARNIPQAHNSMAAGKWDRKSFEGVELYGKTLAVLGMGRIGTEVARRAIAFGMNVLAYDPYLSVTRARSLQVELVESLDDLLPRADFITMHMPLTAETRHMLGAERFAKCRRGVRVINAARGGLIDEAALDAALASGLVAAAALDVYETEPPPADFKLRSQPNLIMTPHLGASTAEAQESVGIEIAQALRACLLDGVVRNAVNLPNLDAATLSVVGPYLDFGARLGRFLSQIAPSKRADRLTINYAGKVNESDTGPITRAIAKGFLEAAEGGDVNHVNALSVARSLGLEIVETRQSAPGVFTDELDLTIECEGRSAQVAGAFFGRQPRIVRVNARDVEARPEGVILIVENRDVPGMVGRVGSLLGDLKINIATMSLSRDTQGGSALTVLNLDSAPDEAAFARIKSEPDILSARVIRL